MVTLDYTVMGGMFVTNSMLTLKLSLWLTVLEVTLRSKRTNIAFATFSLY